MTHSSDVELKKRLYDLDFRVVCISISHTDGNWLRMFPAWHSIHIRTLAHRNLLSPAGLVSPAGHTLAHPDTGPCSTLLDIPLLIPAGYTIAHTGTCSALLDIPLLSLCSVLLDTDRLSPARHIRSALLPEIGPCSALLETTLQVLAQPCWTPLLSPAGNTIAQPYRCLLSPTGHRPLHSPAGHRPLLSPAGHSPAGLLSPDGHRP